MKKNMYINILIIFIGFTFIVTFFNKSNAVLFDYYYQIHVTLFLVLFYLIITRFEILVKKMISINPLLINKTSSDLIKISSDLWNIVRFLILGLAVISIISFFIAVFISRL